MTCEEAVAQITALAAKIAEEEGASPELSITLAITASLISVASMLRDLFIVLSPNEGNQN